MGPYFPPHFRPCTVAVFVTIALAMSACGNQGQTGRVEDTSEVSDTGPDTADTSTTEPDSADTSTTGPETTLDIEDSASPDVDTLDTHDSRPDEETSSPDVPDTAEPDWTTSENYPRVIPTGDPCEEQADCPSHFVCDLRHNVCVECLRTMYDGSCPRDKECVDYRCVETGRMRCEYDYHCDAVEGKPACSPKTRTCTECVRDWQCPFGSRCLDEKCTPADPCETSLDCSTDLVCGRNQPVPQSWCVECGRDADCEGEYFCGPDMTCVEQVAPSQPPTSQAPVLRFKPCESDRDCRDLGLLCNFEKGHCGECTMDQPCAPGYTCRDAFCVVGECVPGETRCAPACTVAGDCSAGVAASGGHVTGFQRCNAEGQWSQEYEFCDALGTANAKLYCFGRGAAPCLTITNMYSVFCAGEPLAAIRCIDAHAGYQCGFGYGLLLKPCGLGEGQPDLQFIRE